MFVSKRLMVHEGLGIIRQFGRKSRKNTIQRQQKLPKPEYDPYFAMKMMRCHDFTLSDPTVALSVQLNIDPKKGDQTIRGSVIMPNGTGKKETICFFCDKQNNKDIAKSIGIQMIGDTDTIEDIKNGDIKFDKLYATAAGVALLKPYARILGPKNLFPNTKVKTLISDNEVATVLKEALNGKLDFRTATDAHIRCIIGRMSYSDEQILENLDCFMKTMTDKKPSKVRGSLYKAVILKSSMGEAWR